MPLTAVVTAMMVQVVADDSVPLLTLIFSRSSASPRTCSSSSAGTSHTRARRTFTSRRSTRRSHSAWHRITARCAGAPRSWKRFSSCTRAPLEQAQRDVQLRRGRTVRQARGGRTPQPKGSAMKTARWNYAVPVRGPLLTVPLVFLSILAAIALALSVWRLFGGLRFTGMNDDYAIGVWKTFNVMTLTALGSSALAVGMTTWIFNQRQLHVVMRAALSSSILFYGTGMFALRLRRRTAVELLSRDSSVALEPAQCAARSLCLHDRVRRDLPALRKPSRRPAEALVRPHQTALSVHGRGRVPAAGDAPVLARIIDGDRRNESASTVADADAAGVLPDAGHRLRVRFADHHPHRRLPRLEAAARCARAGDAGEVHGLVVDRLRRRPLCRRSDPRAPWAGVHVRLVCGAVPRREPLRTRPGARAAQ
jgi:hypothetical protein